MESSILYYADILANTMKLGCSGESATTPALDEENWERLQVSGQIILPDLKEEIHKEYNETVSLFLQSA